MLLLLQTRERMTARELAAELGVSPRTVYRDVDALSGAGVPVYAERGPAGGFRLLDGYRTRLTGMTGEEAEALFLAGLPGPAAELGFGETLAAAQLKLLATFSPLQRAGAERLRERFLLDAPGWYHDADPTPHLAEVTDAVWAGLRLRVRYRRWGGEVERTLEPLGLVVKAGVWYLMAAASGQVRTYRVSRILEAATLGERFERPHGFDLAASWQAWSERFLREMYPARATVRVSEDGWGRLLVLFAPTVARAVRDSAGPPDERGWRQVEVPVESISHAAIDLLRLGAEAEVLAPPDLRERMAATAAAMAGVYGGGVEPSKGGKRRAAESVSGQ